MYVYLIGKVEIILIIHVDSTCKVYIMSSKCSSVIIIMHN